MLWGWQHTCWEPETDNPNGGGTILLGVAWCDQAFYDDRRAAWFGAMHQRIGILLESFEVAHYRVDGAAWRTWIQS